MTTLNRSILIKKLLLTSIILWVSGVTFGGIISPWRAVKTIVKAGESFSILYENLKATSFDEVYLQGPYQKVKLKIDSVNIGHFIYDTYTNNGVNNKIWVSVPSGTPEELYDLVVLAGGEISFSSKSVKVVNEFSKKHTFIHLTDPHISRQWVGTAENGHAKELELFDRFIDVANIIAPDFVIVTGDIVHHYTRFNADENGWGGDKIYDIEKRPTKEEKFRAYYEGSGNFRGIHGLNAPVFSLPGNHDTYGISREDHMKMANQWNNMCGLRVYGFSYGDTRVIAADDYLGDPVKDIPDQNPMSGLQGEVFKNFFSNYGRGKLQIMAQHRPDRIDTTFLDKYNIDVLLNGHHHNPFHEYVGKTPTLSIRPGTVCRSGEIEDWKENLGFFRIFTIEGDKISYSPPLRFCENPTLPYQDLILKLTLDYEHPNNGSSVGNNAIIKNNFEIDLPQCRVRFIMSKGEYEVRGGEIQQIYHTEKLSIVDVNTHVASNSEKTVIIQKK